MKRIVLLFSVAMLTLVSCNNATDPELEAAQRTSDSLQAIVDQKNEEISALFGTLNEIEDNLDEVSSKYGKVRQSRENDPEGSRIARSEITDQIASIDQLLAANKKKIAELQSTIKALGENGTSLQNYVTKLETRIAEQEQQIADLQYEIENQKAEIRSLNEDVSTLTADNQKKDREIAGHIAEANKAYYIVGLYKTLQEKGVVEKSGGVLGMGRKQVVVANLPVKLFKQIDRTTTTTIEVNLRNAVVISSHPESSYELVKSDSDERVTTHLRILNTNLFWQNTKYLVVSTK